MDDREKELLVESTLAVISDLKLALNKPEVIPKEEDRKAAVECMELLEASIHQLVESDQPRTILYLRRKNMRGESLSMRWRGVCAYPSGITGSIKNFLDHDISSVRIDGVDYAVYTREAAEVWLTALESHGSSMENRAEAEGLRRLLQRG